MRARSLSLSLAFSLSLSLSLSICLCLSLYNSDSLSLSLSLSFSLSLCLFLSLSLSLVLAWRAGHTALQEERHDSESPGTGHPPRAWVHLRAGGDLFCAAAKPAQAVFCGRRARGRPETRRQRPRRRAVVRKPASASEADSDAEARPSGRGGPWGRPPPRPDGWRWLGGTRGGRPEPGSGRLPLPACMLPAVSAAGGPAGRAITGAAQRRSRLRRGTGRRLAGTGDSHRGWWPGRAGPGRSPGQRPRQIQVPTPGTWRYNFLRPESVHTPGTRILRPGRRYKFLRPGQAPTPGTRI